MTENSKAQLRAGMQDDKRKTATEWRKILNLTVGFETDFFQEALRMDKNAEMIATWERIETTSGTDMVENIELYTDGSALTGLVPVQVISASWGAAVLAWVRREDGSMVKTILGTRAHRCSTWEGQTQLDELSAHTASNTSLHHSRTIQAWTGRR